jgi:beta-xylosidase
VVLLAAGPALPIPPAARVAVVGPRADDPLAMMGCYSFPVHVGSQHPGLPLGLEVPTLLAALRAELPAATVRFAPGCSVTGPDTGGFEQAVQAAREADVAVVALGDQAGMFGRGTSGEGSDAPDLRLPGVQGELLEAVLAAGTPVVLVLLAGRPYALGAWADRLAGIVQAFFPGEEGGPAVAGVLSGRVNPSGRLPVGVPRHPGGQPGTYLVPPLGRRNRASSLDPTPLFPFGHGLSYTRFRWDEVTVDGRPPGGAPTEVATDGEVEVALTVTNAGERAGTEVVQLYLHDPVAQVTRPVVRLVAYARVRLLPGRSRRVRFAVPADASAFTGLAGHPVVEPGDLELRLSASSAHARHVVPVRLVGPERRVDRRRLAAAVLG